MKRFQVLAGTFLFLSLTSASLGAERPNILWITAEDMSPTLGCWGDEYAVTPNIDRLATQSVRFTNAFATAPVCSPSRSCLITGCYATSLGTEQMRSAFPLPKFIRGFPALLREAGYYTSNNFKTDYNTSSADRLIQESWNESSTSAHWRNRAKSESPFFSVFNLMTSHQSRSMVWTQDRFRTEVQSQLSQAAVHDPDDAPIPAYYPDTTVTRRIVARYYDCVTAMDQQVGEILRQLDEDGLVDDTIVFFYSDHGSGMPRHKRLLHDSGMHVPLLIRFPEKWKQLAPKMPNQSIDRLVSFVDFAPTVLTLAGIDPPDHMQGHSFLGADGDQAASKRDYVFGHRDRIDEVIDLSRSVRDERYLYIRNYHPHLSWNQFSSYSDMSEIRHELHYLAETDTGTAPQLHYAGPTKLREELYDCESDPGNIHNLVDSPDHQVKLRELRDASLRHIQESRDLGFIPESYAWQLFGRSTPWGVSHTRGFDEASLAAWTANSLAALGEQHAAALLDEKSVSARYWGAVGLLSFEELSPQTLSKVRAKLMDESSAVRIEAANVLARHGELTAAIPVLQKALKRDDLTVVLHATRTIEMLGKSAASLEADMKDVAERSAKLSAADTQAVFNQSGDKDLAMFCSFSANGFLDRLHQGDWIELLAQEAPQQWSNVNDGVKFATDANEVSMLSSGKNLWIVHALDLDDFELTLDTKMPDDEYNAGIGFRCELLPNGRPRGYQCEVAEQLSGMLYAIGSGGWVWPKGDEQRKQFFDQVGTAFRPKKWNHFRIRCEGDQIRIWVNGILATDIEDNKHSSGRIALQHHGKGGVHQYRNVRVRPLNVDPAN